MISPFEAGKIIHSGERMTEFAALNEIHSHSQQITSALSSDASINRQSELYHAQVEKAYEALGPLLDHAIRDV